MLAPGLIAAQLMPSPCSEQEIEVHQQRDIPLEGILVIVIVRQQGIEYQGDHTNKEYEKT